MALYNNAVDNDPVCIHRMITAIQTTASAIEVGRKTVATLLVLRKLSDDGIDRSRESRI